MTHAPFDTARFVMDYRSRFPTPVSPDALETQREAGEGDMTCEHDRINALRNVCGPFDDHETIYGACQDCGVPVVSTVWFAREEGLCVEVRPMTPAEIVREREAA